MNEYTVFTPECARRGGDDVFSADVPLAMAFVRDQKWETPMDAMDALRHGTAFASLAKPFKGVKDGE